MPKKLSSTVPPSLKIARVLYSPKAFTKIESAFIQRKSSGICKRIIPIDTENFLICLDNGKSARTGTWVVRSTLSDCIVVNKNQLVIATKQLLPKNISMSSFISEFLHNVDEICNFMDRVVAKVDFESIIV